MPTLDSAPFADALDALHRLWNKFALRGDLDSRNPPATAEEAYNQVIELQLREMQDVAQEIRQDAEEEALVDGNLRRALACVPSVGPRTWSTSTRPKQAATCSVQDASTAA